MNCPRCGNAAHLDFPSGLTRCNGCERSPAWCRCTRSEAKAAEFVPAWRRNLKAKELTAA